MTDLICTVLLILLATTLTYIAALDLWKRKISLDLLEKISIAGFLSTLVASCFGFAYGNSLQVFGGSWIDPVKASTLELMLQSWFAPLVIIAPLASLLLLIAIRRNYKYAPRLSVVVLILEVIFLFSALAL